MELQLQQKRSDSWKWLQPINAGDHIILANKRIDSGTLQQSVVYDMHNELSLHTTDSTYECRVNEL